MGKEEFLMKLQVADRVHLKHSFRNYFTKDTGCMYRPDNMNHLQGQQVLVTALFLTFIGKTTVSSFACRLMNQGNAVGPSIRLPIICIDRSSPLIRDGKKRSLHNMKLYIFLSI